ncbi:serine hydrolase domain-containing protein [Paenibacillus mendelii]|uniref:Serine hydrolase domain-containing protein n=1 Tax=Paenibacillus mendelii TaxID=206163 RepID=A0ABV6JCI7_9BACL|nr:serine hydrolase domain-containing protein [Paenibacillus mendelii]MCQ6561626.1 beta-lactamase family protein [Paenibacillus mendelii]
MENADQWNNIAPLMGMDAGRLRTAFTLLENEVEAGRIPGGVLAVGRNGYVAEFACGIASFNKELAVPAKPETPYDCASLTKVTVTLPLILMLLEKGRLHLQDPLARFIPEFATAEHKAMITIEQLLTHTSGLPPTFNLHAHGWSRERIIASAIELEPERQPGRHIVYSDLGFILLGHLAELLYEEPLDRAAQRLVFDPLGMADSGFCPPPSQIARIAETEWYSYESGPRRGTVHDENAAAMGGVSGHAGLFATARDLSRYATMWLGGGCLNGSRLLSPAAVRLATSCRTSGSEGGNRGLGWVLKGDKFDASGDLLSANSYGHTGFTGTSMYADPASGLTVVMLTNAVRISRDRSFVSRLRATLHNAIAAALTE